MSDLYNKIKINFDEYNSIDRFEIIKFQSSFSAMHFTVKEDTEVFFEFFNLDFLTNEWINYYSKSESDLNIFKDSFVFDQNFIRCTFSMNLNANKNYYIAHDDSGRNNVFSINCAEDKDFKYTIFKNPLVYRKIDFTINPFDEGGSINHIPQKNEVFDIEIKESTIDIDYEDIKSLKFYFPDSISIANKIKEMNPNTGMNMSHVYISPYNLGRFNGKTFNNYILIKKKMPKLNLDKDIYI